MQYAPKVVNLRSKIDFFLGRRYRRSPLLKTPTGEGTPALPTPRFGACGASILAPTAINLGASFLPTVCKSRLDPPANVSFNSC